MARGRAVGAPPRGAGAGPARPHRWRRVADGAVRVGAGRRHGDLAGPGVAGPAGHGRRPRVAAVQLGLLPLRRRRRVHGRRRRGPGLQPYTDVPNAVCAALTFPWPTARSSAGAGAAPASTPTTSSTASAPSSSSPPSWVSEWRCAPATGWTRDCWVRVLARAAPRPAGRVRVHPARRRPDGGLHRTAAPRRADLARLRRLLPRRGRRGRRARGRWHAPHVGAPPVGRGVGRAGRRRRPRGALRTHPDLRPREVDRGVLRRRRGRARRRDGGPARGRSPRAGPLRAAGGPRLERPPAGQPLRTRAAGRQPARGTHRRPDGDRQPARAPATPGRGAGPPGRRRRAGCGSPGPRVRPRPLQGGQRQPRPRSRGRAPADAHPADRPGTARVRRLRAPRRRRVRRRQRRRRSR